MTRLILLNGAPAAGKSTLGRLWADCHPLTLLLDIDVLRSMLGAWPEHPAHAGRTARSLALELAGAHLRSGRDVVVAQLLARTEFIDALEDLAASCDVRLAEFVITADRERARDRLRLRLRGDTEQLQDDAALLDADGALSATYDAFESGVADVAARRPSTRMIRNDDLERAYEELRAALDRDPS